MGGKITDENIFGANQFDAQYFRNYINYLNEDYKKSLVYKKKEFYSKTVSQIEAFDFIHELLDNEDLDNNKLSHQTDKVALTKYKILVIKKEVTYLENKLDYISNKISNIIRLVKE